MRRIATFLQGWRAVAGFAGARPGRGAWRLLPPLLACAAALAQQPDRAGQVRVMTYNLENLMDAQDDPRTDDQSYLPAAAKQSPQHQRHCQDRHGERGGYRLRECLRLDWNPEVVQAKLRALAAVIARVRGADGRPGPEVLVVQEVENLPLLRRLGQAVQGAGYRAVLLQGQDARGIDVGVLTRLPLVGRPRLVLPRCPSQRCGVLGRRGALSVPLALPPPRPGVLRVFAVHLPAAYHPAERREKALRLLQGHMEAARDAGEFALLAGDLNISAGEEGSRRPYRRVLGRGWTPLHRHQCLRCEGTYYYGGTRNWNWFDAFVLPSGALERGGHLGWRALPDSLQVLRVHPDQYTKGGYPRRFRASTRWGVSDHFPSAFYLQAVADDMAQE